MRINKVLVAVAHPDDAVLGCGGFISKLVSEGKQVFVAYCNNGNTFQPDFDASKIQAQIISANDVLGSKAWEIASFKTAMFDTYPQVKINAVVSNWIETIKPDTVLTHCASDLHNDHLVVNKAVMVSCRYKGESSVQNLLTFPVISSSDISPDWGFYPSFYATLAPTHLYRKAQAMECYTEELLSMPHNRGNGAIHTWAKYFGFQANCEYAEPFKVIRSVY